MRYRFSSGERSGRRYCSGSSVQQHEHLSPDNTEIMATESYAAVGCHALSSSSFSSCEHVPPFFLLACSFRGSRKRAASRRRSRHRAFAASAGGSLNEPKKDYQLQGRSAPLRAKPVRLPLVGLELRQLAPCDGAVSRQYDGPCYAPASFPSVRPRGFFPARMNRQDASCIDSPNYFRLTE